MAPPADRLAEYTARRDFARTPEPRGSDGGLRPGGLRFVVQKHAATRLHYDLRLEWNGVLLSWAVTRGPSADPRQKRLAVRTEDHPLDYRDFEGTIPRGDYGAGTVMLWDEGTWLPKGSADAGLEAGNLKMVLQGRRMLGAWALVRMKPQKGERRENWLLLKERDPHARDDPDGLTAAHNVSVRSGRSMADLRDGVAAGPAPARTGTRPGFRKPQLATLAADAPEGPDWIHETKFDGYRCLAALGRGGTRLFRRSGLDWTDRLAALDGAFDTLPCAAALIDGEVVAARIEGSAFSSLQDALRSGAPLVFYAFDLLSLDGTDLAGQGQACRKAALAGLMAGLPEGGTLRMSAHVEGRSPEVFAAACAAGAEGIVSKHVSTPYRGTRTRSWRKIKCIRRQSFVVGGMSPSGKRGRAFASLLLGEPGEGGLRYRGRVGTGFSGADLDRLDALLRVRATSPFAVVPAAVARTAVWLAPEIEIDVAFLELTAEGHVRHGTCLGFRKAAAAAPAAPPRPGGAAPVVEGIAISSPDRRVFGGMAHIKLDVARYYARAGARLTEIAGHRPLSLLRCPDGIGGAHFFQKHGHGAMPAALRRRTVRTPDETGVDGLYATRPASFVAAAQMGTIEFHIAGVRTDRPDRPDRLVFDLDPDEGLAWTEVRRAAGDLRGWLADLGLESGAVVTGGKGVHVWVPLRRTHGWDAVRGFARTLAHVLEAKSPARFTASMAKSRRRGRIFVDWLRNDAGATAISPWSLRARPGAPVAVPVAWDTLADLDGPAAVTLDTVDALLARPCPYLARAARPQSLGPATAERLQAWIDR